MDDTDPLIEIALFFASPNNSNSGKLASLQNNLFFQLFMIVFAGGSICPQEPHTANPYNHGYEAIGCRISGDVA